MERYLGAARVRQPTRRWAARRPRLATAIYRVSAELQQHDRIDDLPFGTRGGTLIRHVFPQDAEYDIKVGGERPQRRREPQQLEVTHRRRRSRK